MIPQPVMCDVSPGSLPWSYRDQVHTAHQHARLDFGPSSTSAHHISESVAFHPGKPASPAFPPASPRSLCASDTLCNVPRDKHPGHVCRFFGQRCKRKSLCVRRPLSFWTCDCLRGQWLVRALLHSGHPSHIRLSAAVPCSLTHCRNRSEFSFPQKKLSVLCLSIWTYALMEGR